MLRDVTITKVRALVFDLVNFKAIEGDLAKVSKMYSLDHYHILNMRKMGLIAYDKKTNTTRLLITGRVNVEEITSLVIAQYVDKRKKTTAPAIIKEHYYSPTPERPKAKAVEPLPDPKKDSILTRLKKAFYVLFRK